MLYSGTDPESYITEYTLVYEENSLVPPKCLEQIGERKWVRTNRDQLEQTHETRRERGRGA